MDPALPVLLILAGVAWRVIRLVTREPRARGLETFARSRDYVYRRSTHGDEVLEIESDGIEIVARRSLEQGLLEPNAHWSMRAELAASAPRRILVRARRDADAAEAELGHFEFDELFVVESELSSGEIKHWLDEASLSAIARFGEGLNLSYEAGTLWIEWSDLDARSPEHLADAIAIVTTLAKIDQPPSKIDGPTQSLQPPSSWQV
ncbi:MAG TPA: hypothetical protein VGH28_07605 [Polyangiaceae bacterium]|jgi:hypothetical protein